MQQVLVKEKGYVLYGAERPRRSCSGIVKPKSNVQSAFFQRMGLAHQFFLLVEHFPSAEFFAKDTEGRFVAVSRNVLWRVGLDREEDLLGLDDTAIHLPDIARAVREDDLRVMRTREPSIDRIGVLYGLMCARGRFLITKLPVLDHSGEVIGIMGYARPYREGANHCGAGEQVERAAAYIRANFRENLAVSDLAKIANLSERQLNRRFQATFHMSVQEVIAHTRIQAAHDALLETDKPIGDIALEYGFYDQSVFTRRFREQFGETPLVFRQRRAGSAKGTEVF